MKFKIPDDLKSYRDKSSNIILPCAPSENLAEIIGIISGDGHVGSKDNRIEISGNSIDELKYFEHVSALLKEVFNVKFKLRKLKNTNAMTLYKRSQGIVCFLRHIGFEKSKCILKIPHWIWTKENLASAFVRGVFDTDGALCLKKNHGRYAIYPVVNITLKDEMLLRKIATWTKERGIPNYVGKCNSVDSRTNKRYLRFYLQVSGYANTIKWWSQVGSRNSKQQGRFEKAMSCFE
ncbi:hypothetical protein C4580_05910 [Candidatus Woesearchaeota archaeon]|nr:MAG: hypothetical protein C4580_05910 [Candidatus Woesearchaeota archaeon]